MTCWPNLRSSHEPLKDDRACCTTVVIPARVRTPKRTNRDCLLLDSAGDTTFLARDATSQVADFAVFKKTKIPW